MDLLGCPKNYRKDDILNAANPNTFTSCRVAELSAVVWLVDNSVQLSNQQSVANFFCRKFDMATGIKKTDTKHCKLWTLHFMKSDN